MTPSQQNFVFQKILPWLGEFCIENSFVNRRGATSIARALNLLGGHDPKNRAEREFLAALWAEVERRKLVVPIGSFPYFLAKQGGNK